MKSIVVLCLMLAGAPAVAAPASQPAPSVQSLVDQIDALRRYVAVLEKENAELRRQLGRQPAGAKAPQGLKIGMTREEFLSYVKIKGWYVEKVEDRDVKIGNHVYHNEIWKDSGFLHGDSPPYNFRRVEFTDGKMTDLERDQ